MKFIIIGRGEGTLKKQESNGEALKSVLRTAQIDTACSLGAKAFCSYEHFVNQTHHVIQVASLSEGEDAFGQLRLSQRAADPNDLIPHSRHNKGASTKMELK